MDLEIIEELWGVIQDRKVNPKEDSYTNSLLADEDMIIEKLKEELGEIEEAVVKNKFKGKDSLVWETSDLLYHLLVLLAAKGVELEDVLAELKRRRG